MSEPITPEQVLEEVRELVKLRAAVRDWARLSRNPSTARAAVIAAERRLRELVE